MLIESHLAWVGVLVATAGAQICGATTPEILPGTIAANVERWTFLVRDVTPESVGKVVLDLDGKLIACERSGDRTATSGLWDVRCDRGFRHASVRVLPTLTESGAAIALAIRELTVTAAELPEPGKGWSICWDQVDIVPNPSALGFPFGESQCALEDLEHPEPELARILAEAGIRAIGNTNRWTPDDDFLAWNRGKRYYAYSDTTHSALAVVAILAESGRFRNVWLTTGEFVGDR